LAKGILCYATKVFLLPMPLVDARIEFAIMCSYLVTGVDGSCAKHLTVESYTVIYAANSHTYYY